MATSQIVINTGTAPNNKTGEPLRNAFTDINTNFTTLFNGNGLFVDARDFAIDPTGNNDSSVAINSALTQATAYNLPVQLPSGIFSVVNVPIGYQVQTYQGGQWGLFGSGSLGSQFTVANTPTAPYVLGFQTSNTVIVNQTKTLPTFCLNTVNGVWLRDFAIMGQNYAPYGTVGYNCPVDDYTKYLTAGVRGGPTITNSPYCAIAIDPLIVNSPSDGGYPGLTYSASFGSNLVLLDNIQIQYFFVGIALSTSGAAAENGSGLLTRNSQISWCDTGVAIGQSQSRLFAMNDGGIGGCRQAFDGINYGNFQGCPPSRVKGLNLGFLYRLFQFQKAFGSSTFEENYAESIRQIGLWGQGSGGNCSALSFIGGDYTITQVTGWAPPPPVVLENHGVATFKGTSIGLSTLSANNPVLNLISDPITMTLEQCSLGASGSTNIPPLVGLTKNSTPTVMKNCAVPNGSGGAYEVSDIYPRGYGLAEQAVNNRFRAVFQSRYISNSASDYSYQSQAGQPFVQVSGVTNLTLTINVWPTPSSLTFNCTNYLAFQVGDILHWQAKVTASSLTQYVMPMLQVSAINSGSQLVTCALLFDPLLYDTVANWNTYQAGSMFVCPTEWAPISTVNATTNGTTAVTLTGGSSFYNTIYNGDWLFGTNMPSYARVVSGGSTGGSGGTTTLTLNIAATGSGSTQLYFGRLYPLALGTPI